MSTALIAGRVCPKDGAAVERIEFSAGGRLVQEKARCIAEGMRVGVASVATDRPRPKRATAPEEIPMSSPNTSIVLAAMRNEEVGLHLRNLAEAVQEDPALAETARQVQEAGALADRLGLLLVRLTDQLAARR